jgi:hypothetical protein
MAGYSGKSVAEKLGLKPGMVIWLIQPPKNYGDIIGRDVMGNIHVAQSIKQGEMVDCIHCFVTTRKALEEQAPALISHLSSHGMLWISWPKKSSGVSSDISEQTLRDVLLPLGIVDVKVCAIDETWSGLKFLWRRK